MAAFHPSLSGDHIAFIAEQPVFFVATACAEGRINLSPKGMNSFRVLAPDRCAYLDLTGSGNETAAHLKRDGRITVMFNSFSRRPLILRLYGRGRRVAPEEADWDALVGCFPLTPGARQIIAIDIESVHSSCGFGVPLAEGLSERPTLRAWAERLGEDALRRYRAENNRFSIDGFDSGI